MLYKEEQSSGVAVSKKASQEMLYMSLYVRDHNSTEGGGKIKKKKKKKDSGEEREKCWSDVLSR